MVQQDAMGYNWQECCARNPQTWVLLPLPASPFPIIMALAMRLRPVSLSFLILKMKTIIPALSTSRLVVSSQHRRQCSRNHSMLSKKVHLDCDRIPHRHQCIHFFFCTLMDIFILLCRNWTHFYFYWTTVDLEGCASFRCTAKWFRYILFSKFSIIVYYRILNIVPCAIQ